MIVQIAAGLFIFIVVNAFVQIHIGGWTPIIIGTISITGFLLACLIAPGYVLTVAIGTILIVLWKVAEHKGRVNPQSDWRLVNDARTQWEMERKYGKRIV
jgi:hypothetical protein